MHLLIFCSLLCFVKEYTAYIKRGDYSSFKSNNGTNVKMLPKDCKKNNLLCQKAHSQKFMLFYTFKVINFKSIPKEFV